jgi:Fe-S oxidoreductase/nitrate reductase gamma subunit
LGTGHWALGSFAGAGSMSPHRLLDWNIPGHLWLYGLFLPFVLLCLHGCYRLGTLVWRGQPDQGIPPVRTQLRALWEQAVLQQRLFTQPVAGAMHAALSWGFGILFLATSLCALEEWLGVPTLSGPFYLYFMALTVDLFGLAATLGTMAALARRSLRKPPRLWAPRNREGYRLVLWLLLAILLTGYLIEGLRIAATADPWGAWSPGGWLMAVAVRGLPQAQQLLWHQLLWWGHAVLAFAFIALLPHTLIRHLLTAPVNLALRRPAPSGVLQPVALEGAEHFGISTITGFPRKDLLDLVACTECGRCQDACPAWATGKPLTPKGLILDLRDQLFATRNGRALVGEVIPEDVLWACTTCGACHQACPVYIEPIPKILHMRRFLVMEEARFPAPMQAALRSLENRGHPYQGVVPSRTAWTQGLTVPLLQEKGTAEYLYWVGCAGAFDERAQKVARAFVQVLQAAGVDFAILGEEERCTGDPARRMGHEYLFQLQAQGNIETFTRYGVRQILTTCPHCFNTLAHEYGPFGGHYRVQHHTGFLQDLLRQGRLRLTHPLAKRVAYHDSCYLGRHNGLYDAPRAVLTALPGLTLQELERTRANSFCCGAGGGLMWTEERLGTRVNLARTEEALRVGPDLVGTACPFCLSMFEDGLRATDATERLQALDLAELVARAL